VADGGGRQRVDGLRYESAGEDGPDELLVVEGLLLLHLQLLEQLVQLVVRQLLPQVSHHVSKLLHRYRRPLRLENRLHCLDQLVLRLWFLVLAASGIIYFAMRARKSAN
jgi:hypothetical protein